MLKRIAVGVAAVLMLSSSAALAGPFEDGSAAYDRGDYTTAVSLWKRAAEQGNASAQNNLGFTYRSGRNVPRDYAEAVKWYRKAADQGESKAETGLGHMYAEGEGVPQDHAEAARWFRKAADKGNNQAQLSLGVAYSQGRGVPLDYVQAYMWQSLAVAGGYPFAPMIRDTTAKKMTTAQIAEAQKLVAKWKPKTAR